MGPQFHTALEIALCCVGRPAQIVVCEIHMSHEPTLTLQARSLVAFAAMLMVLASPFDCLAAQKLYRWRAADGTLVISDRPPPDVNVPHEEVNVGQESRTTIWDRPGEKEDANLRDLIPGTEERQPAAATVFEKDPELCEKARSNLETLNTFPRIRIQNAQGEVEFLSEEAKAAQRREAERIIRIHCD
jgi:hypothetical protein